jgi:hypothetical protein
MRFFKRKPPRRRSIARASIDIVQIAFRFSACAFYAVVARTCGQPTA